MIDWQTIAAVVLAALAAACVVYLYKNKVIKAETLEHAADLLDSITIEGTGFIALLADYARIAVRAVEQLAKTGVIERDNKKKKQAAMDYVERLAKADEVELDENMMRTVDMLIEAAVNELPRNQNKAANQN